MYYSIFVRRFIYIYFCLMNLSSNQTFRLIITLFLLGNGALLFTHSELGLINCDKDGHNTHDYCEIIKIVHTQTNTLKDIQPIFEFTKILCLHCASEVETQIFLTCFNRSNEHILIKHSLKTYLYNESFLI